MDETMTKASDELSNDPSIRPPEPAAADPSAQPQQALPPWTLALSTNESLPVYSNNDGNQAVFLQQQHAYILSVLQNAQGMPAASQSVGPMQQFQPQPNGLGQMNAASAHYTTSHLFPAGQQQQAPGPAPNQHGMHSTEVSNNFESGGCMNLEAQLLQWQLTQQLLASGGGNMGLPLSQMQMMPQYMVPGSWTANGNAFPVATGNYEAMNGGKPLVHTTQASSAKRNGESSSGSFTSLSNSTKSTQASSLARSLHARNKKEPPFPMKLYEILSNAEFNEYITWNPSGKSWRILKPALLESIVIPRYFRLTKYTSFMRQVNGWGFQRIGSGSDHNSYYSDLFVRGNPQLCQSMKRVIKKGKNGDGGSSKEDVENDDEKDSAQSRKETGSFSQNESDSLGQHTSDMHDEVNDLAHADCSSHLGDDEPPQICDIIDAKNETIDATEVAAAIKKATGQQPDASLSGLQGLIRQHGLQTFARDHGIEIGLAGPCLPQLQLPVMNHTSLLQGMTIPVNLPAVAGFGQPEMQGGSLDQTPTIRHSGSVGATGLLPDTSQFRGTYGTNGLFDTMTAGQLQYLRSCLLQPHSHTRSGEMLSHGSVGDADAETIKIFQKAQQ